MREGENWMKGSWRTLIALSAATLMAGAGCGGSSASSAQDESGEWDGSLSTVNIYMESRYDQLISNASSGTLKADSALVTCQFTFGTATVPNGYIEVISFGRRSCAANAINKDNCIDCTTVSNDNTCTLTCNGKVYSNEAAAAESIDVSILFSSAFVSDQGAIGGAILFLGDANLNWPGANFLGNLPTNDINNCDGSDNEIGIDAAGADPNTAYDNDSDQFYERWVYLADINALGTDPDVDGLRDCSINTTFNTDVSLEGVEVPGASIDLTSFGTISLTSFICDNAANCPEL